MSIDTADTEPKMARDEEQATPERLIIDQFARLYTQWLRRDESRTPYQQVNWLEECMGEMIKSLDQLVSLQVYGSDAVAASFTDVRGDSYWEARALRAEKEAREVSQWLGVFIQELGGDGATDEHTIELALQALRQLRVNQGQAQEIINHLSGIFNGEGATS